MIHSLKIQNFRCYEDLDLDGLKRINIVVGENSSGKTALLESIFLASAGSPEIALRFRAMRGLGSGIHIAPERKAYEALWKDLFYSLDQRQDISIELRGTPESTRGLRVFYGESGSLTLPLEGQALDSSLLVPIVFEWRAHNGMTSRAEAKVVDKTLELGGVPLINRSAFFSSTVIAANPTENATRFSELSKENKLEPLLEAFAQAFPKVKNLSLELSGGVLLLFGTVESLQEKIPLGMVSSGANKLASVLLGIATYPRGVVLVDEIENGFYFETLSTIWKVVLDSCIRYDTQFFASTHSDECLKAALPSIRGNEDEFSLVRTWKKDGISHARAFAGRQLESAIEEGVEVR